MVIANILMKPAKSMCLLILFLSLVVTPQLHAANSSVEVRQQAAALKTDGDRWVAQDNYETAAELYDRALMIGRKFFSMRERAQMAVHMSWGDRLRPAVRELRHVVNEEPANHAARIHLARVLSWRGELTEAIDEADIVLKASPDHRDALIVKADALRWQDRVPEAAAIYQSLVNKNSDFDAKLGLAHARLAYGDRVGAMHIANSLNPTGAAQKREYKRLTEAIEKQTHPRLDARYLYYRDSDKNQLNRYLLSYGFWWQNWNFETAYRHTDANDRGDSNAGRPSRSNRADDLLFKAYRNFTDNLGIGAGLGFNQLGDGRTTTMPIGNFQLDTRFLNGMVGIAFNREVLSDTAQLIHNRIRVTSVGVKMSHALTDRLAIKPSYSYRYFSDASTAHDAQFNTEYALFFDPKLIVGHRFRFLDYGNQQGSGLFDPDHYYSNRGFMSLYMQRPKYYVYAEAYLGQQRFERNGASTSDFVKGGAASIGWTPTSHWNLELYVEGGNFAAGSSSGFTYFTAGPRVIYRF